MNGRRDVEPHETTGADPVTAALTALRRDGVVVLAGAQPSAVTDARGRGRGLVIAGTVIGSIGLVLLVLGVAVRIAALLVDDATAWEMLSLLMFPGILLVAIGGSLCLGSLLTGLNVQRRGTRDTLPVVLDPHGFRARGIALAWSDVDAPRIAHVTVRADVGGRMAVMPLSDSGRHRVHTWPPAARELVGPREYLRFDVRYALLPGIHDFTEGQVLRLFGEAHALGTTHAHGSADAPHPNTGGPHA